MKAQLKALLDHISEMGQELSPDAIDRLAGRIGRLPTPAAASGITAPTARERALLGRLVELWAGASEVEPHAVSFALRAAQVTAEEVGARQGVELVWTGPRTDEVPVRRNDQALQEVIDSAEHELLLVTYVVYDVPTISKRLTGAIERGAAVRLVLEFDGPTEGAQENFNPVDALGKLPDAVEVYEWPFGKRPEPGHGKKRGYIHAKCAVADRHLAFVSSANLTTYAMQANMELGVLVRGGRVPERIADHFERLIAEGVLEPWVAD